MAAAPPVTNADFRHQTYGLKSPEEHIKLYDEWAASYDQDVLGDSTLYVGPTLTAQAVEAANGRLDGEILDAGCGTGLCGVALARLGAKTIDGIDLSPGMLRMAERSGAYRSLSPVDMSKPITVPDGKYDVVTCAGTFTTSHLKPNPALTELVRVLKKGGLLVATVLVDIWQPEGFEAAVHQLRDGGIVEVLGTETVDYRRADKARAKMVVLRRL